MKSAFVKYLIVAIFILSSCENKPLQNTYIDDDPLIYYYFDETGMVYYDERFTHGDSISKMNNKTKSLFYQGKRNEAIKELKKILKIDSLDPIVLNHLGLFYKNENKFNESIYYLNKSIKQTDSLYLPPMTNLGDLFGIMGEQEKAEKIYYNLINNSPYKIHRGIAFNGLARMYYKYGYINKAKKMNLKAKENAENHPKFFNKFSQLDETINNYHE